MRTSKGFLSQFICISYNTYVYNKLSAVLGELLTHVDYCKAFNHFNI